MLFCQVGDFALLLSNGMSVRAAVVYNLLSSVFAAAGLVAGLLLGTQGEASGWLLSATVGVFIYVALVCHVRSLNILF